MSNLSERIAGLSPKQLALLDRRLRQRRDGSAGAAGQRQAGHRAPAANLAVAPEPDDENLVLAGSVDAVDGLLSKFYGRFPWPWPAQKFDYLADPGFEAAMVNQDVGDWSHGALGPGSRIWVAGCGVNQALATALRFRQATVVGSDVSARALELCGRIAGQIGVANLELREESINHVDYRDEFDYVICTGVVHHNAEPAVTLARLAAAMKPRGIMELMVYNRFHRIITSAFQKAVRVFSAARDGVDFEWEVALARSIVDNLPVKDVLEKAFIQYMEWSESDFADLLIQPVEHSYTVESLQALARGCGLDFVLPCVSSYAKHLAANLWHNLEFADPELRARYYALPDARRWQVTNLLLHDKSPLLWFYLRREDGARKTEREVCEEFLNASFERCATAQHSFLREEEVGYVRLPDPVPYPLPPSWQEARDVVEAVEPGSSMRAILRQLGFETSSWPLVNSLRNRLATSAFPYLRAIV